MNYVIKLTPKQKRVMLETLKTNLANLDAEIESVVAKDKPRVVGKGTVFGDLLNIARTHAQFVAGMVKEIEDSCDEQDQAHEVD